MDSQLTKNGEGPDGSQKPRHGEPKAGAGVISLFVDGYIGEGIWQRGANDLPVLNVAVDYVVQNRGNISAEVLIVWLIVDSHRYSSETFRDLMPGSELDDSFSVSIEHDQNSIVEVEASCGNATSYWSDVVDAELPRRPKWTAAGLFVTPREGHIQSVYREIRSRVPFFSWILIRDWVSENIEYESDFESHDTEDFWQLGRETLETRTGDCEDFAILLCSLLRADGWSPDDVFVVVGENERLEHHAWGRIKVPIIGWYNIEPQLDGWNTFMGDLLSLSGYSASYSFNDQYFVDLSVNH